MTHRKNINALAPQGCEPGTDQAVALCLSRKQMNKHTRAGEVSHTCGIWGDSNHELANRFKFRRTTGLSLVAKGRKCYCRSVVGCVRHATKCGILTHLNCYVLYISTGPPKKKCIHTLTKENSTLYNRLL